MAGETAETLPDDPAERREADRAPPLPIEAPLVQAVRHLEALKSQVESLLILLEKAPDAEALIQSTINDAVARMNGASAAIWQFQMIRSCRGQC